MCNERRETHFLQTHREIIRSESNFSLGHKVIIVIAGQFEKGDIGWQVHLECVRSIIDLATFHRPAIDIYIEAREANGRGFDGEDGTGLIGGRSKLPHRHCRESLRCAVDEVLVATQQIAFSHEVSLIRRNPYGQKSPETF